MAPYYFRYATSHITFSIAGILLITGCLMSGEYVMTENDILGKRMEPVFMILGQSAGIIACMTNQSGQIFICPAWRNSFANRCITNLFVIYL
jgi:hypothetical protein